MGAPEQAFWDALHAGDTAAGGAAVAQLQAAVSANPQDSRNTMILGLASYWLVAENGRDPATAGQTIQKYAPLAGQYVNQAHAMMSGYGFLSSFAGFFNFDLGWNTGNASQIMQGKKLIDQGLQQQPESGFFFELLASVRTPATDAQMQTALDATWKYYELCGGQPVDRTNPDFTPYFTKAMAKNPVQFCADDEKAPHGEEGIFLYFGDLLVKSGSVDVAKTVYIATRSSQGYATWPHKDTLEARIASDLTMRAAAYQVADAGPSAWPAFGDLPYSCTVCHGATAK